MLLFRPKESEFVTQVKYFPPQLTSGKSQFEGEDERIEALLKQIAVKLREQDYMQIVKEELIFLSIEDRQELKFTIFVREKEIEISRGWDPDAHPSIILPVPTFSVEMLSNWLEKGFLNKEEMHRMIHRVAVPAVESFYKSKMLNKLKNPGILRLHKLIHLELENPMNYQFEGKKVETKITVMNVLGQFIILPGHVGVAPILFKVNEQEALEYYILLKYKLPFADSLRQKKELFEEYMRLRAKTLEENTDYKKRE